MYVSRRQWAPNALSAARQVPIRLTAGAFLINSGLTKRNVDEESAAGLHGFAAGTYPFLGKGEPRKFVKMLSTAEIALGAALVVPTVPAVVAGAGLSAFSLGLIGLYLKTPGMRQEGSLRWTEEGLPLAKDSWLVGIGLFLLAEGLTQGLQMKPKKPRPRPRRRH